MVLDMVYNSSIIMKSHCLFLYNQRFQTDYKVRLTTQLPLDSKSDRTANTITCGRESSLPNTLIMTDMKNYVRPAKHQSRKLLKDSSLIRPGTV